MLQSTKKRNEGFTIIEVLIVLAIAGLILLIVFLAVPALQRNQRNTARKNDAGRIATAISDFIANNGGSLPTTAANMQTIYTDAGTLSQFANLTPGTGTPKNSANAFNLYANDKAGTPAANNVQANAVVLITHQTSTTPGYTCNGRSVSQAGTSPQNAVLMYTVEAGGGSWSWNCLDVSG